MNDVKIVTRKQTKPSMPSNAAEPPVYRYSGPPSIQMRTWGERPRGAISVKKDNDYIMGMGQQDPKTEMKSSGSTSMLSNRVHSFSGAPAQSTTPSPTPTRINTNKTLQSSRWSSFNMGNGNYRSQSPEPNQLASAGTLPKVVSSFKQRLEESEKERKQSLTSSVSIEETTSIKKVEPEPYVDMKSMSATSTLERSKSSKPSFSIGSASSTLERPVGKKAVSPAVFSISTASSNPVQLKTSTSINEIRKFQSPEPRVIIDRVDSPKVMHVLESHKSEQMEPKVTINNSKVKIQAFQSFNTPSNNNNGSLEDKKRFFQGIKPVESPTKEVILPAVNMKNNIATIQRVFEQRQLQKSASSASMNGSERSFPSRESSASPALSNSSSVSYSSSTSSTPAKKPEFIGSQSSSNIMVQKVIGRGSGFNLDAFRRTPSPSTGHTYNDSSDRSTPSPTVIDGHGPIRISTTSASPSSASNIKNVGNKAIIIVGGDSNSNESQGSLNNNQFKQQLRVNGDTYQHQSVKVNINGSAPAKPKATAPSMIIVNSTNNNNSSSNYASIKENFSKKPVIVQEIDKHPPHYHKSLNRNSGGGTPPPPPPPAMPDSNNHSNHSSSQRPTSLGGFGKSKSLSTSTLGSRGSSMSSTSTPTSPMTPGSADPRADIFNAIKNSNGNFGLKKVR